MKKSEIIFYDADGAVSRTDIDLTSFNLSILKLIFIFKSEISKSKIEQVVIKSPFGNVLINENAVNMIKNIFSAELFGGINKLDVYDIYDDGDNIDVYDDTEFIWKRLD